MGMTLAKMADPMAIAPVAILVTESERSMLVLSLSWVLAITYRCCYWRRLWVGCRRRRRVGVRATW